MFLTVHLVAFLCVQVMGKVPTISINKTDGCHVYLSKDSLSCEIVSAKSSEMNILVPGNDGDFVSILSGRSFKKKKKKSVRGEVWWYSVFILLPTKTTIVCSLFWVPHTTIFVVLGSSISGVFTSSHTWHSHVDRWTAPQFFNYLKYFNWTSLSYSLSQTECPVPEQFKTVWDGKKLVTTATEIAG